MNATRILLVDDEKEFVQTLAERLELRGLEPEVAYDGKAALDAVSRNPPHLVVLDLYMPGISGDVVLHSIKTRHPRLPVILLTGHGAVRDDAAESAGLAYACLAKPLALDELLCVLRQAAQEAGMEWGGNA